MKTAFTFKGRFSAQPKWQAVPLSAELLTTHVTLVALEGLKSALPCIQEM